MNKTIAVIGGGLAAMILAQELRRKNSNYPIVLIERQANLGGLSKSFDHGPWGLFDHGPHLYLDTGLPEIDQVVWAALPENHWTVLSDTQKDISGVYARGKLNLNSQYLDLRDLPPAKRSEYAGEILLAAAATASQPAHLDAWLRQRFGCKLTNDLFAPLLEQLYRMPAKELDILLSQFIRLDRVVLFDEPATLDFCRSETLRRVFAIPDQRRLPKQLRPVYHRALYPKKRGFGQVVQGLEKTLLAAGVRIIKNSIVTELGHGHLTLQSPTGLEAMAVEAIVWSAGLESLNKLLAIDVNFESKLQRQPKQALLHVVLDRPTLLGDLYYLYGLDPALPIFRITNYSAYVQAPETYTPLTFEFWPHHAVDKIEPKALLRQLIAAGILAPGTTTLYSAKEANHGGLPLPSVHNLHAIAALREKIMAALPPETVLIGPFSSDSVFFLVDVLQDAYKKLSAKGLL